ncbi:MAG: hypothetical protein J5501_08605 [Ruminococcus sp.]|nr:hypothetical protein [Ruminococcus sp.]
MKALVNGAKFDALGGIASVLKLDQLSKLLDMKTMTLDAVDTLTSNRAPEPNYDDIDWIEEFCKNPYEVLLDQIKSLLGRFG